MEIEQVECGSLNIPDWHATYVLKPDLSVLAKSISQYGILSPLVVQREGANVIDGGHRLRLVAAGDPGSTVPVVWVDCGTTESMVLHIQLNRGRGTLLAHKLSKLIKTLERAAEMTPAEFSDHFAMKFDELELMLDGSIIKRRKVADHNYSRAWVPVEAPPGSTDSELARKHKVAEEIVIEKPPNPDR